jgi:hypothetical protein
VIHSIVERAKRGLLRPLCTITARVNGRNRSQIAQKSEIQISIFSGHGPIIHKQKNARGSDWPKRGRWVIERQPGLNSDRRLKFFRFNFCNESPSVVNHGSPANASPGIEPGDRPYESQLSANKLAVIHSGPSRNRTCVAALSDCFTDSLDSQVQSTH